MKPGGGQEAPGLFINSSLRKGLGAETHGVYGLCVRQEQPYDGDNGVMPVPTVVEEQLSLGHVLVKAFFVWGMANFGGCPGSAWWDVA